MKIKVSVMLLILAIISLSVFSVSSVVAFAYSGADIEIEFTNNQVEFFPTATENGYTFDYANGMNVKISGKISSDPNATSGTVIMQNGVVQNGIYKAGVYDVTVSVTPSDGSGFVYKTFKVTVNKMQIENIRFDEQSVNVEYGNELKPKLLLSDDVIQENQVRFVYYNSDKTAEIEKPVDAGEYFVEALIESDNYSGSATTKLHINKANCGIDIQSHDPIAVYTKTASQNGGFDISELVGASIINTDNPSAHILETYIKSGEEYILQDKVLIPGEYQYKLFFKNGSNYSASPVFGTITVKKGETEILSPEELKVIYSTDMDIIAEIKSKLNVNGGFTVKNKFDNSIIDDVSPDIFEITLYTESQTEILTTIENCGKYYIELQLKDNDFYESVSSEKTALTVERRDISNEISTFGEQKFDYGVPYDVLTKFIVPEKYSAPPDFVFKKNIVDDSYVDIDAKPVNPGKYAVILTIDADNYYGSKTLIFTISKLPVDPEAIQVDNLQYVYGDDVDIKVTVDERYSIAEDNVTIRYRITDGDLLDKKPVYAGNYQAIIRVENDYYSQEVTVAFTIAKKELKVKALNRSVVYGDDLFKKDGDSYQKDDFLFTGVVGNDYSSILSSFVVKAGTYSEKNMNLVVGEYQMKVYGNTNPNYEIVDDNSGILTINKRTLTVKVSDVRQYVGSQFTPVMTVSNCVYNDLAENMVLLFETYYVSGETELTGIPSASGEYDICIRVKADNIDCQELKNYNLDLKKGKLTLITNQKTDSAKSMILVGKFDESADFKVNEIKPNDAVNQAIKNVDSKYTVGKLLYIPYTFSTVDDSAFTVRIDCTGLDLDKIKIMIAYSTDSFEEVEFTVMGNYAVIRLNTMASYYAVCVEKTLPLVWIIVIAVSCAVVVIGLAIFLWVYFTGANVKSKKGETEEVTLSGAVVRNQDVKTEDDELDELIENFDESTVTHKEDPANRLKRQEEEQLREQYRLRIRRMRSGGDKTLADTYQSLGMSESDFDEEKAIDRLIEEDRAKKIQEDKEKQKQQEEKAKNDGKTFVINQRQSGELGNTAMPVTPKASADDDDDDIIDF